ncbi:MAG: hypothetical protein AB4372_35595 [Xenococcus sp. (in: cyanobacteria)]
MSELQLNLKTLVNREESKEALVRFEDTTDELVPRLRYNIPLPSAYDGFFFMETDFGNLPWKQEAYGGKPKVPQAAEASQAGGITKWLKNNPKMIYELARKPLIKPPIPLPPEPLTSPVSLSEELTFPVRDEVRLVERGNPDVFIDFEGHEIPVTEIEQQVSEGNALLLYYAFGGTPQHTYIPEPKDQASANPRFVIVEHYRLSSHFGDYGAGRTVKTFSLWPGEETQLYIRSWRRTEKRFKAASSIFDSYTQEAALDFANSLEAESTDRNSYQEANNWKASGGASLNLGIVKIGGGGGGGGSSKSARETFAKSVAKISSHTASKASSKRETTVSTELEISEAEEFEIITERQVRNVNLSRTLNLVCRELNQEFETYLSLVDVSIAVVNDYLDTFDEVPLYDVDSLLEKYLKNNWDGNQPPNADPNPRKYVKDLLWREMSAVFDYQGNAKQFLEEANHPAGGKYWRVKRRSDPDAAHPFYPGGKIPVEGIVLERTRHSVRTDGIIIDALLGHGVSLDNYALGTQQEVLIEKQLENKKTELALELINSGDTKKIEAFKSLFVCCGKELIEKIIDQLNSSEDRNTKEEKK